MDGRPLSPSEVTSGHRDMRRVNYSRYQVGESSPSIRFAATFRQIELGATHVPVGNFLLAESLLGAGCHPFSSLNERDALSDMKHADRAY